MEDEEGRERGTRQKERMGRGVRMGKEDHNTGIHRVWIKKEKQKSNWGKCCDACKQNG